MFAFSRYGAFFSLLIASLDEPFFITSCEVLIMNETSFVFSIAECQQDFQMSVWTGYVYRRWDKFRSLRQWLPIIQVHDDVFTDSGVVIIDSK